MNVKNLAGHAAGAALFTTVWEVAVHLPPGDPGAALVAAGVVPWLVAAVSLALIERQPHLAILPPATPEPAAQTRPAPVRMRELTR